MSSKDLLKNKNKNGDKARAHFFETWLDVPSGLLAAHTLRLWSKEHTPFSETTMSDIGTAIHFVTDRKASYMAETKQCGNTLLYEYHQQKSYGDQRLRKWQPHTFLLDLTNFQTSSALVANGFYREIKKNRLVLSYSLFS